MTRKLNQANVHWSAVVGVLLIGMLAVGCTPTPKVAVIQQSAQVRCELAEVWAGASGASPLPQLGDCGLANNWHNLSADDWVTTDEDGEAWVDIDDCEIIYVFQSSGLIRAACPKSDYTGGNVTCSVEGTSAYNNACASEVIIQTPSSELVLEGTWLSVTYLEDRQLTLVIVLQGQVQVRPVLDGESFKLGEPVEVSAGQLLYTAPDAVLERIGDLPPREPLPLEQLKPLAEALALQPWLERVWERAKTDGHAFPPPWQEAGGVTLRGGGGPLEDERVQEAVLTAVDWQAVTERVLAGQDVAVAVELPSWQLDDVRSQAYDPEKAHALLAEAGVEGFEPTVMYPLNDEALGALVQEMAEQLGAIGIEAQLEPMTGDAADWEARTRYIIMAGEPVLWLSRP
jgi:hypothetical protein